MSWSMAATLPNLRRMKSPPESLLSSGVIAAASVADCAEILSEDLSHEQVYLGMPVRNPFMA